MKIFKNKLNNVVWKLDKNPYGTIILEYLTFPWDRKVINKSNDFYRKWDDLYNEQHINWERITLEEWEWSQIK